MVPGSRVVKAEAESEGLDKVFREAGFEWRDAGCSMCIGMNDDVLAERRAFGEHFESQFRRAAGQGRTHASGESGDGGSGGDRGPLRGYPQVE